MPNPISMIGINIFASKPKNIPKVTVTPVKTKIKIVKTMEKTTAIMEVKQPNIITFPFTQLFYSYY